MQGPRSTPAVGIYSCRVGDLLRAEASLVIWLTLVVRQDSEKSLPLASAGSMGSDVPGRCGGVLACACVRERASVRVVSPPDVQEDSEAGPRIAYLGRRHRHKATGPSALCQGHPD